ncbi:hypothetical protein BDV39DRAFT_202736 [Aspergillus sergii]|uniref:Uncharacterized protein n=1 Tax=Aspergillus sergii TaxID=1034303 RepID=A0A5N6XCF6_9EURO|nr:hypothetical protein BDV39DRAFT_202736 [Aspergillus sergii]
MRLSLTLLPFIFGSLSLAREVRQCEKFIKDEDYAIAGYSRPSCVDATEDIIQLAFREIGQACNVTIPRSAVTDILENRHLWNDYAISFQPPVSNSSRTRSGCPFVKSARQGCQFQGSYTEVGPSIGCAKCTKDYAPMASNTCTKE